jgi:hypothetical protein
MESQMFASWLSRRKLSYIRISTALVAAGLGARAANAGFITVPDVLTVTARGTIEFTPVDGLGLFGGGDLEGLPYTEVFTIVDTLPAWANSFALTTLSSSDASVTTTIAGHSYTMSGSAYVGDFYLAPPAGDGEPFDERVVDLTGVGGYPGYNYAGESVARFPAQWATDPAAESLFLNNTVSGQTGYRIGSVLNVGFISGDEPYTGMNFNVESVSISYTTTTAFIPEPSTWITMAIGFAALGMAGYWKGATSKQAIRWIWHV